MENLLIKANLKQRKGRQINSEIQQINKKGTEQGSSTVNGLFLAALFSRFEPQTTKWD